MYVEKNDEIMKRVVREYLKVTDPKEFEKWEKYFIFIMLN